ncbi:MAG: hypothetical protein RL199_1921 [Pseudomonadota bacterium]|jgi:hypothetical protein
MRRAWLLALACLLGCRKSPPPPAAPAAEVVPVAAAAEAAPPAPDPEDEDPSLDGYGAFSADGHAFALAETSPGAGVLVLSFYAVPAGTVEKRLLLDSAEARRKAVEELTADGFPRSGRRTLPPGLSAAVSEGKVTVTVAGRPAAAPYAPFPAARPVRAEPLAVSKNGKMVAVRSEGVDDAGEFGPETEMHFVKLFE